MFVFAALFLVTCFILHYLNNYLRRNVVEDLVGKSVFITGTDSGFGRKLALDLDSQGFHVYAGCYTSSGAASLQKDAGNNLKTLLVDVTNDESVLAAKKTIESNLPAGQGLWAVVNNAGIARGVIFEFASFKDYEATMDVNFYGILRVNNAFIPLVKKARGRIVNQISIAGRLALVAGPYSCSKFAAEAYSDGLRRQMARLGVKVSIIEPGFFQTYITSMENFSADIDQSWAALPDDVRQMYGEHHVKKVKRILEKVTRGYPLASTNQLHQVTDSIRHAICSSHPKARYVCGVDAHVLYRPAATIIPDWLIDFVIGKLMKIF